MSINIGEASCGVTPQIVVKTSCVGGSTHQIPIEVRSTHGKALTIH